MSLCDSIYLLRLLLPFYSFDPRFCSFTFSPPPFHFFLDRAEAHVYRQAEGRRGTSDGEIIIKHRVIVWTSYCRGPRDVNDVPCWDQFGGLLAMGAYVRGLQHTTSLAYLSSLCHTLLLFVSMHTLTPNVQFVFTATDCDEMFGAEPYRISDQ